MKISKALDEIYKMYMRPLGDNRTEIENQKVKMDTGTEYSTGKESERKVKIYIPLHLCTFGIQSRN